MSFRYLYFTFILTLTLVGGPAKLIAQSLSARFYLEGFYRINKPESQEKANADSFLFNHNRDKTLAANLILGGISYETGRFRSNLAIIGGTYSTDNYADEPGIWKHVYEANLGYALTKNKSLWLDLGVMPSYIGFESAISSENLTLSRSILAENSPYYVNGAKLSYSKHQTWEIAFLALTGWQRIVPVKGNSMISLGHQLKFRPSDNWEINWSSFYGTDDPDHLRRIRWFNNFYFQTNISSTIDFIGGFDWGIQQVNSGSTENDHWLSPVIILKKSWTRNFTNSFRIEHYSDAQGVIVNFTGPDQKMIVSSYSFNFDYRIHSKILFRSEFRRFYSDYSIFETTGSTSKHRNSILFSLSYDVNGRLFKKNPTTPKQPDF